MSLSFGGGTNVVNSPSLTPGTAFTYAARVNPSVLAAGHVIAFRKTGGSPECVVLNLRGTNTFGLNSKWGTVNGGWSAPNGLIATTGIWYHLAMTYNWVTTADDPIFYLNGASVAVTETSTPSGTKDATVTNTFHVGNAGDLGSPITALMQDAVMWPRILTPVEITNVFVGGPLIIPGALWYYPMDDTGVAQASDYSGNGNHGTVSGATRAANAPVIPAQRIG